MSNALSKAALLCLSFILGISIPAFADTGLYQTDPAVLKQLNDLAGQLISLRKLVRDQNEVIQKQSADIEILKAAQEGKPSVSIPAPAAQEPKAEIPAWLSGMKQGGDFKLRYEAFDNHGGTDQDRNRFRARLRYGIEKAIHDFTVGFRLATGGTADPTATNQTLGERFVYKSVVFDKFFAKYVPGPLQGFGPVARFEAGGGKFDNPFLRASSQMVWDPDVTPEGIYETVDFKAVNLGGVKISPFAIGGQFLVAENAAAGSTDSELYGVMGGFYLEAPVRNLEKPVTLTSAISYYDFRDYARNGNFGALARGNTSVGTTFLAAGDFNVLDIYHQLSIPMPWVSVSPFFDFAKNLGDDVDELKPMSLDDAWGLGIKLGEMKQKGDWEASYSYYYIEPNAVVGAFSDSDFGGAGFVGHADRRGSLLRLGYKLTDDLTLSSAGMFVNTVTNTPDEETRRFQVDLGWKF